MYLTPTMEKTKEVLGDLIELLRQKDRSKLMVLGFLPYTSIVRGTEKKKLIIYGRDERLEGMFNELQRLLVDAAITEGTHIMSVTSHWDGKMIKPHSDNKTVFLVLYRGWLEFFGFKDGNVWRGQGISGDWLY